jgi:hypothetical protein
MGLEKNTAGQKWIVYAFDRTDNTPKTGDAANITANLRIDGAAADAVDDTNPTELEDGYYYFDLTQAETNGNMILICPASSTSNIQVIGSPAVIFTVPVDQEVNVTKWLGAAAATPTVAGVPEVDITHVNGVAASGASVIDANVVQISGDSTAADNLELQYDTTGVSGDTFPATQAQIGNLTSGTAAINTVAESFTKVGAEPETNTYTATHAEDGTYHIVEDDATATDGYYQFDVGGNGVPVSVTWLGYAQSNGDSYTIWA